MKNLWSCCDSLSKTLFLESLNSDYSQAAQEDLFHPETLVNPVCLESPFFPVDLEVQGVPLYRPLQAFPLRQEHQEALGDHSRRQRQLRQSVQVGRQCQANLAGLVVHSLLGHPFHQVVQRYRQVQEYL